MVFRAAQSLYAFAVVRAGFVDVVRDRRGANKAHRFHIGMHEQGVDRFFVALDHVEHAVWQARFFQQVGHEECGRWINRAGLQHKSVAASDGDGEHPHGHHHRKVERCDACHHAQWLAHGPVIDAGGNLLGVVAFEQLRDARGEFNNLNTARDLALGVGKHLAVLGRDHVREFIFVKVK